METLDALVKDYVRKVRDNSSSMLERLNADLEKEQADIAETKRTEENLEALLLEKQEELKATKRQRIRDIMKHPEQEELLEETYDELEAELTQRIAGIQHQIEFASDKRIQVPFLMSCELIILVFITLFWIYIVLCF